MLESKKTWVLQTVGIPVPVVDHVPEVVPGQEVGAVVPQLIHPLEEVPIVTKAIRHIDPDRVLDQNRNQNLGRGQGHKWKQKIMEKNHYDMKKNGIITILRAFEWLFLHVFF